MERGLRESAALRHQRFDLPDLAVARGRAMSLPCTDIAQPASLPTNTVVHGGVFAPKDCPGGLGVWQ
jgi:hypothetical protein